MKVFWGAPGTGKTSKAISILADAVEEGKTISYDTFRRGMARDALFRLLDVVYLDKEERRYISTTHSICFHLLGLKKKDVLTYEGFKKFCENEGLTITLKEYELTQPVPEIDTYDTSGGAFLTLYNNCVNCMIPFDEYEKLPPYMLPAPSRFFDALWLLKNFPKLAERYEQFKQEHRKVDFSDMLRLVYEDEISLSSDVHISDETHDKTPLQYALFKMWAQNSNEVYCCLDFNQRIYSFWGTNLTPLHELENEEIEILHTSFRLGREQYAYARRILHSQKTPEIECKNSVIIEEQRNFLPALRNLASSTSSIMLLARTKYQLEHIACLLDAEGIPIVGDPRFSWSSKELKLLSSLRNLKEPSNPFRLLDEEESELLLKALSADAFSMEKTRIRREKIQPLPLTARFLQLLRSNPLKLESFILKSYLKDPIRVLKALATSYNPIKLLTIHGSKGLEADYVFLFDGITRRIQQSIMFKEEFENEQRVWYVGVTRARKKLTIIRSFFPPALSIPFLPSLQEVTTHASR